MEFEQEGLKTQENATKNQNILSKNRILVIASVLLLFLITLTLILTKSKTTDIRINKVPVITPPVVIITSTPAPVPPNWATSSAILKIDNDVRDLTSEIDTVDFSEPVLGLPQIDVKVDFRK